MPDETPFAIAMVFQGLQGALQAPPGQRRFLELAFSESDGVSFALYDTQGMAIDLRNHICPVLHHRHLDAETDPPRLLAEHGVAMKATSNGSPARLVFHEHGFSVFEENGEKLAADIVLGPGPASVRVGRACPMEGLFEWTCKTFRGGHGAGATVASSRPEGAGRIVRATPSGNFDKDCFRVFSWDEDDYVPGARGACHQMAWPSGARRNQLDCRGFSPHRRDWNRTLVVGT